MSADVLLLLLRDGGASASAPASATADSRLDLAAKSILSQCSGTLHSWHWGRGPQCFLGSDRIVCVRTSALLATRLKRSLRG
jgi:hypothetical protein